MRRRLAFEQGAIPAASGRPSGGAKLLVLKQTRTAPYATPVQAPQEKGDGDRRGGFRDAGGTTWWISTQVE